MKNKKLALLLGKLPEDRKEAFVADMKTAGMGAYEAVVAQYGITLTEDEKAFLTSNALTAIGDEELQSTRGGLECAVCSATSCSIC